MLVATWNVNSVRARLDRVYTWLRMQRPDIVCLQETKCTTHSFPHREIALAGYNSVSFGQPSYNGVAILSPHPIEHVRRGWAMTTKGDSKQARLISATVLGTRVISAYVPNGSKVGSDKFEHKLQWMQKLREEYLDRHFSPHTDLLLCGDFNVAPSDQDVYDADALAHSILSDRRVRMRFEDILAFGLQDTFRLHHPDSTDHFSWWDWRTNSFAQNKGVRIDFILATDTLTAACTTSWIDHEERSKPKPSDHAPVLAQFNLFTSKRNS